VMLEGLSPRRASIADGATRPPRIIATATDRRFTRSLFECMSFPTRTADRSLQCLSCWSGALSVSTTPGRRAFTSYLVFYDAGKSSLVWMSVRRRHQALQRMVTMRRPAGALGVVTPDWLIAIGWPATVRVALRFDDPPFEETR
jgi:hypothetical protein